MLYTDKKVSKYELFEGDTLLGISYSVTPKAYIIEQLFVSENTTVKVTGTSFHLYKAVINARIMLLEKNVLPIDESSYFKRQLKKEFNLGSSIHQPEIDLINDL